MTKMRSKNGFDIDYAKLTKIVFLGIYSGMILTMVLTFFG